MAKKGSHGGAWKVAYADFVTAMMALFMVLWICAQDKKILLATSRYFQSPFQSPLQANTGVMPFQKTEEKNEMRSQDDATGQKQPSDRNKQIELAFLNSVAADFYRLLHLDKDLEKKPIDIEVTSDGLRVTLYDRDKRPLFADSGMEFTDWGRFVMQNLAWLIDRHHFRVTIDGHTRSRLALPKPDYTAWELSTDRANASRRSLVHYAVDPGLIERVTGYADTRPIDGEPPDSESNQRITLSLALTTKSKPESGPKTQAFAPARNPPGPPVLPSVNPPS